jgi:hypothetical protein
VEEKRMGGERMKLPCGHEYDESTTVDRVKELHPISVGTFIVHCCETMYTYSVVGDELALLSVEEIQFRKRRRSR